MKPIERLVVRGERALLGFPDRRVGLRILLDWRPRGGIGPPGCAGVGCGTTVAGSGVPIAIAYSTDE